MKRIERDITMTTKTSLNWVIIELLEDYKKTKEKEGFIPTVEMLIEELKEANTTWKL